jgi:hypothetical protein
MGAGSIINGVLSAQTGGSSSVEFGFEGLQDLMVCTSGEEWTKRVALPMPLTLSEVASVAIQFPFNAFVGIPLEKIILGDERVELRIGR